ncbi:Glycosyltransferase involved in cell wall bisynthesis [Formosa sp. Hel1_31_208]|uniref:glycosyltransferase family 2 protein n=1 Tax=Formosa sp. Hel1_31_208 TaxID=1798225 RepID=UPI000879C4CA|nr:glycosyltransferase family 2 protein [Formosa sp. Hel1_31_208]SDS44793.1 Glycosyltransferase involved in cell wall bisynthesis [Formosa sp. Hel1_31_208]
MSNALISIVIPFKNTLAYLPECLNSIIKQSYQHWELLIVDDHSTDNSYDLVLSYAKKDDRIKLFKNKGIGIIEALRLAYSQSSGTYITRMDSDDIMHSDRLNIMSNQLQHYGTGHMSLGQVKYFSANGIGDGYATYETWLNGLTQTGTNYSEIYKECVIPSPCWMVHKIDFDACGAFQPNRYPEDYDLTFRFYKNKIKCIPSNKVLHYWRDYSTRASRTHEHYAENHFLELKVHYFLELNHDASRPLTLWGAGQKGKKVAQLLKGLEIEFIWICDNPKKIGKHIYDELLHNFANLSSLENPQSIVTVANQSSQKDIRAYFKTQGMQSMVDYYFFC